MNYPCDDFAALQAAAHRARTRAIHRLLFAPLIRYFKESFHAARSHFAAAGS